MMEGHDNSAYVGDGLSMPQNNGIRKKSSFLAVDNSELNSHTYVYDANKSLQGLTVSQNISLKALARYRFVG